VVQASGASDSTKQAAAAQKDSPPLERLMGRFCHQILGWQSL